MIQIMRHAIVALLLGVSVIAVARGQSGSPLPEFETLLARYLSGDRTVLGRTIHSESDLRRVAPWAYQSGRIEYPISLERPWRPERALFYVEFAIRVVLNRWPEPVVSLTDAAASYLIRRDTTSDLLKDSSAFEAACHSAILGAFQGALAPDYVDRYLTKWIVGKHRAGDPRFVLATGISEEQRLLPHTLVQLGLLRESELALPESQAVRQLVERALIGLEQAKQSDVTRAEASIRQGVLLVRSARYDEALRVLSATETVEKDPFLRYWGLLFRGKALEALGRLDSAAQNYRDAHSTVPAQSASVSLANLMFRNHDRANAVELVGEMLTEPPSRDPWLFYWFGQGRFVESWLSEAASWVR